MVILLFKHCGFGVMQLLQAALSVVTSRPIAMLKPLGAPTSLSLAPIGYGAVSSC